MSSAATAAPPTVSPDRVQKKPHPFPANPEERVLKVFPLLLHFYADVATPSSCLPLLLTFATGCTKHSSIKAFLNEYSHFDDGAIDAMPTDVSDLIRTKMLELVQASIHMTDAEKTAAASHLTKTKWKGQGGRQLRLGRKWWHYCADDKDRILQQFPEARGKPLTDAGNWFYLAIRQRCNGLDSFHAMKEYDRLWCHKTDEGKFVTLKAFKAQRRHKKAPGSSNKPTNRPSPGKGAGGNKRNTRSNGKKGKKEDPKLDEDEEEGSDPEKTPPPLLAPREPTPGWHPDLEIQSVDHPWICFVDKEYHHGSFEPIDGKGE